MTMTKAIEFQSVSKKFPKSNTVAVDNVSFDVEEGEFITILGPSGCGKTTLLKMINRLYEPDDGQILMFQKDIAKQDAVALRRTIGYVIQQVGLFPHMTIEQNIAIVPKLLKWQEADIRKRVDTLLEVVGLSAEEYKKRYPSQLSGGQQQRVGLARALVTEPKIMLLDEPFGAIDAITRTLLQDELLRIHKTLKKTFLLVTHDINEAFKLGTRVMIMKDGKIVQFDEPKRIAAEPANEFVSALMSSARSQGEFWEQFL